MRQVRWASWTMGLAMALAVCGVRPATADVTSDRAAAILEWPTVLRASGEIGLPPIGGFAGAIDTVIQLSNTSTDPVNVHCFYENANAHCTNTGEVCASASDCCDGGLCGVCLPGWNESDFHLQITPRQPLGWLASEGVSGYSTSPPKTFGEFAIDGVRNVGIGGSSNAGSRIPPVPEDPFLGSLRCIAVDADDVPTDRNVLAGEATIEVDAPGEFYAVGKSNAVGIQAIEGAVNDDRALVIGGPDAEYNGCPNFLTLDHYFDFAQDPTTGPGNPVVTILDLVPCSQNYREQDPGAAVVQYLVYNEFEQRFSTSRPMQCKQFSLLSNIDTTQNERSIFSAGVSGTLTGQTRINPIGSGLFASAHELHLDSGLADFNVQFQGERAASDVVVLP